MVKPDLPGNGKDGSQPQVCRTIELQYFNNLARELVHHKCCEYNSHDMMVLIRKEYDSGATVREKPISDAHFSQVPPRKRSAWRIGSSLLGVTVLRRTEEPSFRIDNGQKILIWTMA